MLKKYVLLISLLISTFVYGQELDYRLSGFVTTTVFSNKNWFLNTATAALNFDVVYDDFAVRGQVSLPNDDIVRRLTLEKAFWIKPNHEAVVKVGLFPRLDSFYYNVTDSPGTSILAILPFAKYNHRMIKNSTYNSMEGISLHYNIITDNGAFKTNLNYGKAKVEKQCQIHAEAFRVPCFDGYKFNTGAGSYSIGTIYEFRNWSFLGYTSKLNLETELLDPTNPLALYVTSNTNKIALLNNTLGVKYNTDKWWVQSEIITTKVKTAKVNDIPFTSLKTLSYYFLGGYYWTDKFSTHVVYSTGSDNKNTSAQDIGIGGTYVHNDLTLSIEYHKGRGIEWAKHFTNIKNWNSWVASITYRF